MYLFISLLVLLVSTLLFRRAAGTLDPRKVNIISWQYYYGLLISSFIGSLFIVYGMDARIPISDHVIPPARFQGWLAIQYVMVTLPLAMVLTQRFFGVCNKNSRFTDFCKQPIPTAMADNDLFKLYLYLLSIIALGALLYTLFCIGSIPLFEFFTLSPDQMLLKGIWIAREFPGNVLVKNFLAQLLLPILSFIAFVYWYRKRSTIDLLWFGTLFFASIIVKTLTFDKAPIVLYLLTFFVIAILLGARIKWRTLLLFALAGALLLVVLYASYGQVAFTSWNTGLVGRLFFAQVEGTYLTFSFFPDRHDFLGFGSLLGESDRSMRVITQIAWPKAVEAKSIGVYNSLFVAEAWACFGLAGVLVAPFIVGFVIQVINLYLLRSPKSPVNIALYAYMLFAIPLTGGFLDFIWNPSWIFLFLIFVVPYLLLSRIRISLPNS